MNGRFFLSLAHPEMRFRDIAKLVKGTRKSMDRQESGEVLNSHRILTWCSVSTRGRDRSVIGRRPRVSAPTDAIARVYLTRFGKARSRRCEKAVAVIVCGKRRDRYDASKSCYATFRAFPTFRASAQRVPEYKEAAPSISTRRSRGEPFRMMKHGWDNYVRYAWGKNELRPISKRGHSASIFGASNMGATIVDGLDTLYIMGLHDEFKQGRDWIAENLDFDIFIFAYFSIMCFSDILTLKSSPNLSKLYYIFFKSNIQK
ncbi:Mannosyl-oligosaccharide 1,2-alpha-mannosidase IB [Trachymyrmex zeteki]|uniref:alpha-1,2-Mannosidase n=1 Tax=Mycetomoellerius zeteki TaxID=64791 RepID=A0A151WIZ6_9HYME|nr:Mannosyl-oligosaccharide 1,2-alpha-mannosidase IB [Trachymyrmex zeteki]